MNNANEYIISQLKKPTNYSDIDFILWMVNKMTHEEVCSLDSDLSEISETVSMNEEFVYDWDAIRRICHCIKKLKARYSGGNKTLSKLIAELKENNSFEVADELFDRFDYISYNEQKRVLEALLNSEYRCMARQLLDDEWAKMFLTTLQRNWIKEGDTTAVKYIIKYSDEDFLLKHIDKLANEWTSEYNLLCIRLGHNPRFTLDERLLWRKWSYYTVMCVLGRGINSKEILAEVFSEVKQAIFDASDSLADIEKSIRFILTYVKTIFDCPIVFYTGTYFNNERYIAMINLLYRLQKEYDFYILDLFNDVQMQSIPEEMYNRYMADRVHPTLDGYSLWWTPRFIEFCEDL